MEEKKLVFVFQGDSITDGAWGRNFDPNHIMGHGYAFAIASRLSADFPELNLLFHNRGVSGDGVPELQRRWQQDTLALKPDVLSILIGVNDTGMFLQRFPCEYASVMYDIEHYEKNYRAILTAARQANPNLILVLGIPFVFQIKWSDDEFALWWDDVARRQAVVRKMAVDFNAVLVDYPAAFTRACQCTPAAYWNWDGIHPTVPAHELMAREWLRQASKKITFLANYRYM